MRAGSRSGWKDSEIVNRRSDDMKRRILAWAILIGFVLLLLNLIVFRFYWQLSMVVYLLIVFAFLLTNGKLVNNRTKDETSGFQESENDGMPPDEDEK